MQALNEGRVLNASKSLKGFKLFYEDLEPSKAIKSRMRRVRRNRK